MCSLLHNRKWVRTVELMRQPLTPPPGSKLNIHHRPLLRVTAVWNRSIKSKTLMSFFVNHQLLIHLCWPRRLTLNDILEHSPRQPHPISVGAAQLNSGQLLESEQLHCSSWQITLCWWVPSVQRRQCGWKFLSQHKLVPLSAVTWSDREAVAYFSQDSTVSERSNSKLTQRVCKVTELRYPSHKRRLPAPQETLHFSRPLYRLRSVFISNAKAIMENSRAASKDYFHFSCLVYKMPEKRTKDTVLQCLVLSAAKRYSVFHHRRVNKPESIHI